MFSKENLQRPQGSLHHPHTGSECTTRLTGRSHESHQLPHSCVMCMLVPVKFDLKYWNAPNLWHTCNVVVYYDLSLFVENFVSELKYYY